MNGSKLLHEAGVLVEQGWCQGTGARDAHGKATDVLAQMTPRIHIPVLAVMDQALR